MLLAIPYPAMLKFICLDMQSIVGDFAPSDAQVVIVHPSRYGQ